MNWTAILLTVLPLLTLQAEDALILHLPFDGGLGTKVLAKGKPKFVPGKHGQAISLKNGAHLVVPLPKDLPDSPFSFSFWIQPGWHPEDSLPHPILEIPAAPRTADGIGWAPLQIFISKGWSETISPNYFYGVNHPHVVIQKSRPGRWMHMAVVFNQKEGYTASYVDGEGSRRPHKPEQGFNFGRKEAWLGSRIDGKGKGEFVLDDFRIYRRALQPADLEAVAGAKFPPPRDYSLLGAEVDPARVVETPHRKCAKPYAGGKTRVLFVSEGVKAREVFELAQRLEIEPLVVTGPAITKHNMTNPESFYAMGAKVESILKEEQVDCVIIAAFGWNLFKQTTRDAILDYVRKGGGLLFSAPRCIGTPGPGPGISTNLGPIWIGWKGTPEGKPVESLIGRLNRDDEEYLTAGVPWKALKMFQVHLARQEPASLFRGGTVGKGRILVYDLHIGGSTLSSLTPGIAYLPPLDPFDYDYAVGVAARAVLWASGKDSPVRIRKVEFGSYIFFRKLHPGFLGDWAVEMENRGEQPVRVRVEFSNRNRGPDAPFEAARDVTLKPGKTRIAFRQTLDRLGTNFADVRMLRDGKVADWRTGLAEVHSMNPRLETLSADSRAWNHGEAPEVKATIILKDYGNQRPEPGELRWRLFDAWQREVARGRKVVGFNRYDDHPARLSWALPPLDSRSLAYVVSADLHQRGKLKDQKSLKLLCRRRGVNDFVLYSWGGGHNLTTSLATQVMRDRYGLTCIGVQTGGNPVGESLIRQLEWSNRMNLRPWIHAAFLGGRPDKDHIRQPDTSDPEYRLGLDQKLRAVAAASQDYSPLFYSLGDETIIGPREAQPTAAEQEAFLTFLMAKYKKIEALNKVWHSEYKKWKEVVIPSSDVLRIDKVENRKLKTELWAFRNTQFAGLIGVGVDAARSVDRGAAVGIEGIFGLNHAWGAFNYWKVARKSSFMGQYTLGRELDIVRSFQRPGDLLGCWYNYSSLNEGYSRYGPWHTLLRGLKAFGWYTTFEGSRYTALNPDFSPFDHFRWTWQELEPIMHGLGKLVLHLERDDPGVYLLYEHRNLNRHSPWYHAMLIMTMLLEDMGIQYNFISKDQVAAGALARGEVKLLVLTGQWVMTRKVAAGIRSWVQGGGKVFCDVPPAVADGFERYEKRLLDDIFVDLSKTPGDTFPLNQNEQQGLAIRFRSVGKGRTLLMGDYPKQYMSERYKMLGNIIRAGVSSAIESLGVQPAFQCRTPDGRFSPVTVTCFRDGVNRYVGLQRDYKVPDASPIEYEITGPEEAHIYDARHGKYLGKASSARLILKTAEGRLLSFLPYRATDIRLEGLKPIHRAGDSIRLKLILESDGRPEGVGVFRLDVSGPDGKRFQALSGKILHRAGIAEENIQIAWNDPVGKYTLRVTDIATGVAKEIQFEVSPARSDPL